MPFDTHQISRLSAPLAREHVKTIERGGRAFGYVEGWHVIAEANDIFGFDAWSRETIDVKCVAETQRKIGKAQRDGWSVTYTCRVRVTVGDVSRDGCGAGHGIDADLGTAHESALKEAETDAMKRAFMTFGNPFGLALYDKSHANIADVPHQTSPAQVAETPKPEKWDALKESLSKASKDGPDRLDKVVRMQAADVKAFSPEWRNRYAEMVEWLRERDGHRNMEAAE